MTVSAEDEATAHKEFIEALKAIRADKSVIAATEASVRPGGTQAKARRGRSRNR